MKYTIMMFLGLFLIACSQSNEDTNPQDLAGKKALLNQKTDALKKLEAEITTLKGEIATLSPVSEKEVVSVLLDTLESQKFTRFIELQGTVQTDDVVMAASEIGGRILQLTVKEGQRVSKGQLIARTDAEAIRTQRDELVKALDLATDVYDRQKRLWDQNIGSEIQYLQSKNNKERLEKSLLTVDAQLRKSNVYAPISGVVDMVFLKQGEVSSPGMPIIQILNTGKVKIVSDVPENYLGKVKVGNKVDVYFPSIDKQINRPVTMLGRTIDPANRTFKIEIKTDNSKDDLKPNLLAVIKMSDFVLQNAIVVPMELVQQEVGGQKFVYVAEKTQKDWIAKKANVTTGESSEGNTVINSGLKAGDFIITKGARSLTNGQTIKPENIK